MTMQQTTTELPPFLLQHLAKSRWAKARSIMTMVQKTSEHQVGNSI